ncbi:MAG: tyrosine--tRNA ligase [Pseudomonadota bacterium]
MIPGAPQIPFLEDLERRGLLVDKTVDVEEPDFSQAPVLYVGFDPSASSLHAGSLMPLLGMDRFRRRGGQLIVLVGGATGLIGDPSGKDQERSLQPYEEVEAKVAALSAQIAGFFARTRGPEPLFVNNADWYRGMDVIHFLRDVGKHFSVNQMLTKESVRARIEREGQGISFTEFSYQLLQSYDFLHLFRAHGCTWQMGASDQWGNIVSGVDLVRRCTAGKAHGLTLPLLTNSEGKKYGKSESGAVWLDPEQTSPYAFFQFWRNTADADVARFLTWLTDLSLEEIAALMEHPAHLRVPQARLAALLTARVHGDEQAVLADGASEVLFSNRFERITPGTVAMLSGAVPTCAAPAGAPFSVADALLGLEAVKSKGELRRLVQQRGVKVNGVVAESMDDDVRARGEGRPAVIVSIGAARRFLVRLG